MYDCLSSSEYNICHSLNGDKFGYAVFHYYSSDQIQTDMAWGHGLMHAPT